MGKTARGCRARVPHQHPAILPWPSGLLLDGRASFGPSLKIGSGLAAG